MNHVKILFKELLAHFIIIVVYLFILLVDVDINGCGGAALILYLFLLFFIYGIDLAIQVSLCDNQKPLIYKIITQALFLSPFLALGVLNLMGNFFAWRPVLMILSYFILLTGYYFYSKHIEFNKTAIMIVAGLALLVVLFIASCVVVML